MPVHRNVLLLLAVVSTAAAQTRPARGSLTVLYTVGAEDGTVLDHVSAVLLRRDGHLLIADQGQRTILAFDATGRAQAPLGRTGAGPAEYRAPVGLASIGDTIAVLDPRNARIGLFSPTGHWYGQWRVQPITGDAMIRLYRVAGPEFYAIASVPGVRQPAFVRYDARGAQDTIVPAPSVEAATHRALCKGSDLGIRVFTTALHPRRLRLAGPRSSYLDAETGTYRIEQRDAGGSVRRTFIGTATPIPITDAAWDSAGEGFAAYLRADPRAACDRRTLARPASHPVLRAMWWDDRGRLWVERRAAYGYAFDVFDAQARLLATLPAPPRQPDIEPSIVGDRLALATLTAEGAPTVTVFRLTLP